MMKEKIEEQVKTPAGRLRYDFGWRLEGGWTEDEGSVIREAASRVAEFIQKLTGGDGAAWVNSYLPAILTRPALMGKLPFLKDKSFVYPWTQVRLSPYFMNGGIRHIVHEMGHVLDNSLGGLVPATFVGGGAADRMLKAVGGHPEHCFPRFVPRKDYAIRCSPQECWANPTAYGNTCVAEDFAETFTWTIFDPVKVPVRRLAWMQEFLANLKP